MCCFLIGIVCSRMNDDSFTCCKKIVLYCKYWSLAFFFSGLLLYVSVGFLDPVHCIVFSSSYTLSSKLPTCFIPAPCLCRCWLETALIMAFSQLYYCPMEENVSKLQKKEEEESQHSFWKGFLAILSSFIKSADCHVKRPSAVHDNRQTIISCVLEEWKKVCRSFPHHPKTAYKRLFIIFCLREKIQLSIQAEALQIKLPIVWQRNVQDVVCKWMFLQTAPCETIWQSFQCLGPSSGVTTHLDWVQKSNTMHCKAPRECEDAMLPFISLSLLPLWLSRKS